MAKKEKKPSITHKTTSNPAVIFFVSPSWLGKIVPPCSDQTSWIVLHHVSCCGCGGWSPTHSGELDAPAAATDCQTPSGQIPGDEPNDV